MAPPKRKSGGRVTAPGTRPSTGSKPAAKAGSGGDADVRYESGRYTAPTSKAMLESPSWVPMLMLALFVVGAIAIMARYLWWDSNIPMVVGMACLLGGLFTATRWR